MRLSIFLLVLLVVGSSFVVVGPSSAQRATPADASVHSSATPAGPAPGSIAPFFPNIRVTDGSSPYTDQVEPTMVVNRSGTIFVGWKETNGAEAAGIRVGSSYSTDRGATFAPNILMNQSHPGQGCTNSDPWMALGPDDRVQYAYLEYNCSPTGLDVSNTTNGQDWSNVHFMTGGGGLTDKDSIVVDPSGRIYAAWDEGNAMMVSWSDDGGTTWKRPFIDPDDSPGGVLGAIIQTSATGTVYLTWWDFGSDDILFDWSADRGLTWHTDKRVNDRAGSAQQPGSWTIPIPAMNVDQNTGAIYIAWPDSRNGNQDIYFANSTDGGETWGTNHRTNDDTGSTTQYMVDLAIDSTGKVHAAWEDKRNGNWNIFYANSTDDGQTWTPNLRVSTEDTPGSYQRPGDYFAIEAGPDDAIHVVWTDGRDEDFNIYYARSPGFPSATVTITANPVGLPVTVDGTTSRSPVQYTWLIGTMHNISVSSPLPAGSAARYVWTSWSDGGAISHPIIAGGDLTITAFFKKQYEAKVSADPVGRTILVDSVAYTVAFAAWWDDGSGHTVEAPSPQMVSGDVRYVWVEWSDGGARAHGLTANAAVDATATFLQEQAMRVSTDPIGPAFLFDGTSYSTASTFWLSPGSYHTVGADTLQPGATGVRYRFASWSDGGAATHVVRFTGATSLRATFSAEYYLTVTSPLPGTAGSGWYANGTLATATVSSDVYAQGPGERLAFQGWVGDASGTGLTSNPILMDGPKTAVAQYGTQFYLEVSSAYGTTTGSGWYAAASTAQATVSASEISTGQGTRRLLMGWAGDARGVGTTSDPIVMDEPKVATAVWKTQYYLTIQTIYGVVLTQGWYDAGSTATAQLNASSILLSPGRRVVFLGWSGDASGMDASGSSPILIDRAKVAVASWQVEYELRVTSSYGTSAGTGWYSSGSFAVAAVNASVIPTGAGERVVFAGWTGDASGLSATSSNSIRMDAPRFAQAAWQKQYLVQVDSDVGVVEGGGWYAEDSSATLQAPSRAVKEGQTYVFSGWTGDASSELPTVTVSVDHPLSVRATWTVEAGLGASTATVAFVGGLVAIAVAIALILLWRRRRREN